MRIKEPPGEIFVDELPDDALILELSHGLESLISSSDVAMIERHRWRALKADTQWYAMNEEKMYLHRLITDAPAGLVVHHRGLRDVPREYRGLDNHPSNLEVMTQLKNAWLREPTRRTGLHGVTRIETASGVHYRSRITIKGKEIQLGRYTDERAAALRYDQAVRFLKMTDAPTNGIEETFDPKEFAVGAYDRERRGKAIRASIPYKRRGKQRAHKGVTYRARDDIYEAYVQLPRFAGVQRKVHLGYELREESARRIAAYARLVLFGEDTPPPQVNIVTGIGDDDYYDANAYLEDDALRVRVLERIIEQSRTHPDIDTRRLEEMLAGITER